MELQRSHQHLEASLLDLHASVNRLIKVIRENAHALDERNEVMNKLPMLDFYNDDLYRNIVSLRRMN